MKRNKKGDISTQTIVMLLIGLIFLVVFLVIIGMFRGGFDESAAEISRRFAGL